MMVRGWLAIFVSCVCVFCVCVVFKSWCVIFVLFLFFAAPLVSNAAVVNNPASGGASLTLSGANFGANDLSLTAHVLLSVCATTQWSSSTALACRVLSGGASVGTVASVRLTVGGVVGTATGGFTYDGSCA